MSKDRRLKAMLVAALVAAAALGRPVDWLTLSALAFGIVNVLVSVPGTAGVRRSAIGAAFFALVSPPEVRTLMAFVTWLVWPPAFLVAWALARAVETASDAERPEPSAAGRQARVAIAAIIGAVAVAALAYRAILGHGLEQTAALFVGLPALLAILVVFAVSPRSATGVACKAVTVGMLVSMLFLGEGMLCVVMSAPLFYLVAGAIGLAMDRSRRGPRQGAQTTLSCLMVLALIPLTLEGVTGATSFNREESVTATRIVLASPEAVKRALFELPRFDRALPLYLRAGFPRPVGTRLERSATGMRLVIGVRGGEMRLNGMEPRAGDLTLELDEVGPGFLRWRAVSDSSHMTHFLLWREATVRWEPVGEHATRVTWTLRYRRSLDPAWYFGPSERYAAGLAAGYLIDAVATP